MTPTYPVFGRIQSASGQPLTGVRVVFVPANGLGLTASGDVSANGDFSLTTRKPGDGAPAGDYKIRIEPLAVQSPWQAKLKFPVKYVDEESSGLIASVKSESNTLEPLRLK